MSPLNIPTLPFHREGNSLDPNARVIMTGPCFLSCGCGQVVARWASLQQNLITKLPHGKPKASRIVNDFLRQNDLTKKFPELSKHQYGIVLAHTDKGFETVDIMNGVVSKLAEKIADLIKRGVYEQ